MIDGKKALALSMDYTNKHGGSGGTTNYNSLSNRPQINGHVLSGNKTSAQLGLQGQLTFDDEPTPNSNNPVKSGGINTALAQKVDKVAGKDLSSNDFTNALKTKLEGIEAGAEVNKIASIVLNGVTLVPANKEVAINVITRTVNNLTNYYLKAETYSKTEVDDLLSAVASLTLEIVEELPTTDISTTTIYLVPVQGATNVYMQYAYINNNWTQLGTSQVDLSNYYTKAQIDLLLAGKQNTLTLDNAPTANSDNFLTSGTVHTALAGKQDALTFDNAPTENSDNSLTSGTVFDALEGKQDTLEFDTEPTVGSHKMVDSDAVAQALENVDVGVATEENAGIVKPDGTTITVDSDGTLHGSSGIQPDEADFTFDEGLLSLVPERRIFNGTMAEWEALNSADKALYKFVIPSDDDESLARTDVYSTTETKTNKVWIDGKPIYRIVFDTTVTKGTSKTIDISSLNIDNPIIVDGFVNLGDQSYYLSANCILGTGFTMSTVVRYHSNIQVRLNGESVSSGSYPLKIIFEYTKATD